MSASSHNQRMKALFPEPSNFPPSILSPFKLPGISHDSTDTLRKILIHNQENHHVFFNDRGFHNHAAHHVLAIYAMGANPELLNAAYETHKGFQRKTFLSPVQITSENFADHLGDEDYFHAYLKYFSDELLTNGNFKTLENYLYSKKANSKEQERPLAMFSRFFGGLLHPAIHTGYGLEFGLPGMVAEGLAQTAVVPDELGDLLPSSYWDNDISESLLGTVTSRISSLILGQSSIAESSHTEEMSVFNVMAILQKDGSLNAEALGTNQPLIEKDKALSRVLEKSRERVLKYAQMWSLNISSISDHHRLERKLEELAWATVVLYGAAGWNKDKPFHADFILLHLVTSGLFIPSICAYLPPYAIQILLRTYFAMVLVMWVSRARPAIKISREFFTMTSPYPQEPKARIQPAKDTLTPDTVTPNPWLALTQSVLVHRSKHGHLCKIHRTLMHWASLFGSRPPGYWKTEGENIEGIELLDGSFFARVASLTLDSLGWMREGQEQGEWNFSVFV